MHQRGSDLVSDNRSREVAMASSGVTEPLRMGRSSGSNNLTTGEGGDRLSRKEKQELGESPLLRAQELHRSGQLRGAEEAYRNLLLTEANGDAAAGLGAILRKSGRDEEAEEHYRWALNNCTWSPNLISNACNWLREHGKSKESLVWLERGLNHWPDDLHLRWGWVLSLHHSGFPEKALRNLEELIKENGNRPLLLRELVACLVSCERIDEAINTLEMIRKREPNDQKILEQYLNLLQRRGRSKHAWQILKNQRNIDSVTMLRMRAILLLKDNHHDHALPLFEELCKLKPLEGDNWLNLAACQKALKQMVAPLQTLKKGLKLHPNRTDLKQAYGSLLVEHGKWDEGLKWLTNSANDQNTSDCQQFNLQFAASGYRLLPVKQLKERAEKWELSRGLTPTPIWSDHIKDQNISKRLKIGYFSQDLNTRHPVGRFMQPLLRNHDRKRVEVIAINCGNSSLSDNSDIKQFVDKWYDLGDISDIEAARKVSELELDILVELGGYTGGQRIRILTAKPAPIQLSYLGYFASTHLNCIDGVIGDKHLFPAGMEKEYPKQKLYRLPRCYMAFEQKENLVPRRTATDKRFRFGCFNHSRKLSDPCLDLFSEILTNNPDSIIVLKSQTFIEKEERERIRQRFIKRGIHDSRLKILKRCENSQSHLMMYGEVDVALDPIPYGGATTTAEAIWMGVPVICLAGEGMVGRLSASILEGAGLGAAIASDINQYKSIANLLAKVGPRDDAQRLAIRKKVSCSDLTDAKSLANHIEETYQMCWESWVRRL